MEFYRRLGLLRLIAWQTVFAIAAWYAIAEFPFTNLHFIYELY